MSDIALRFRLRGPLAALESELPALTDRSTSSDPAVRARTAAIIERVRAEGDAALFDLALELDGARLESLEVTPPLLRRALDRLSPALRASMERAAANIDVCDWSSDVCSSDTIPFSCCVTESAFSDEKQMPFI